MDAAVVENLKGDIFFGIDMNKFIPAALSCTRTGGTGKLWLRRWQ
ncbi:hypothetical protein [Salinimicrobium sp. HB62]|nr:hypothetical protein [Salinimicrobium sp. HB62]